MATLVSTNMTNYGGAGPFDLDYPASIASGDLILLTLGGICVDETGITTPSGFALVGSVQEAGFRFRTAIYQRTATGSEAGPVAVTQGSASNGIATISRITGHNGVDTASNPATTEGSGTTVVAPSVSLSGSGQLVIVIGREAGPSSMTITRDGTTTDSPGETSLYAAFNSSCYISYYTGGSGTSGTKTFGGMTDGSLRHAMTIAINEPVGGGGGVKNKQILIGVG